MTKGAVPHWSRWEKSTTTMGPVGRILVTVVAVMWVLSAATQTPITLIFVVPLVVLVIRAVWRPGWVIPPDQAASVAPTPREPVSTWWWDRSEFVRSVALAALSLLGVGILLYSHDDVVRLVVAFTGVVALAFWLWRVADGSR